MAKRAALALALATLFLLLTISSGASEFAKEQYLSQAQAEALIKLVRAQIGQGQAIPTTNELTVEFKNPVMVGWQDKNGKYRLAVARGTSIREAAISASQKLLAIGEIPQGSRLYVSVLLSYSALPEDKKSVLGNGLYGLGYNSENKTCFATPEFLFYRGINLNGAKRSLKESQECCIAQEFGTKGFSRFKSQTIVERQDGSAAILFRGAYPVKLEEVNPENVRKDVKLGADFLVGMIRPNGQFYYQYDPRTDKLEETSYNLLRHAGTVYSLYQVCRNLSAPEYCDAAERAWDWLVSKVKTEKVGDKVIAYPEYKESIKLGGIGLMLIALAERAKATGKYDRELAKELVNFVEFMQRPNGDVYYYYKQLKGESGRRAEHKAFYYPGEATLGLIRVYEVDKDPRFLELAEKSANFLVDKRWRILGIEITVPPDAWLTMALCELYQIDPKPKYSNYAFKLAQRMISEQHSDAPYPDYVGGFSGMPPGVTATGGRMEAITATYFLAKNLKMDTTDLVRVIKLAVRFQINCTVREEDYLFYPNPSRALGIFRRSPTSHEARIDYNQHNLSSLLSAMNILAGK